MATTKGRLRRTKIVATLGPATDRPGVLERMVRAGVDVVRVNFSHGEAADHVRRVEAVRGYAREQGREVAVLADLQGPKIRTDRFESGKVTLEEGARFVLDATLPANAKPPVRTRFPWAQWFHDNAVSPSTIVEKPRKYTVTVRLFISLYIISSGELAQRAAA